MTADRHDHFQRIRGELPQAEVPPDAPHVSPELISYLQSAGFGVVTVSPSGFPGSRDHEIQTCHAVTFAGGQLSVIQFLMNLVRTA